MGEKTMTEQEKAAAGLLYDANYDPALLEQRRRCKELCHTFNQLSPTRRETEGARLLRTLLGSVGERPVVTAPFWCDYGCNITLGDDFYANHNCIMLDGAPITIGSHVFFGPNCCLSTAGHPLDAERRNQGLEYAKPITIGDDVWLGANVTVLPGVTIGRGAVIGAGSVVTRDIPAGVVAVGVPCRPVRPVPEKE